MDLLQFPTPYKILNVPGEISQPNFDNYDIFLINNRIQRLISRKISPNISFTFYPTDTIENGVLISTDLYIRLKLGYEYITMKDITKSDYELLANSLEKLMAQKYDSALIWMNDEIRPLGWVSSIIQSLPTISDYKVIIKVKSNQVLVCSAFDREVEYSLMANKLYNHIEQYLDFCWNKGTIFVTNDSVERMITDWRLKIIYKNDSGYALQSSWSIFNNQSDWSLTTFLLSRLNSPSEPLELNIGQNLIIHAGIAQELHRHGFIIHFDDFQVFVRIADYRDLMLVSYCYQRSLSYSGQILYISASTIEEQKRQIQTIGLIAGPDNMNRQGQIITLRKRSVENSYISLVNIEGQWQHDQLLSLLKDKVKLLK